ncbi:MAG: 16S rRNA (cytidine(1402)-2'-O)-methyltransferase, partial [Elusimicrobiales bacterium]|nr:16S rRNA (cytidine(1402)-2'-O)-methyltransferase [Elusimicrobiales bacterium]
MLYVIATPIGDISELTPKAVDTLKRSDFVICEDTRVSIKLLNHFGIKKRVIRYNEYSEKSLEEILNLLLSNRDISLITDAGIPVISDPGWKIVDLAKKNNIKIKVVGINSSLIMALVGSGFDASRFTFLGFLPRSSSKIKKILAQAVSFGYPFVVYESPNRVIDLLLFIKENFGELECVIARELTKIYEEWIYGNVSQVLSKLKEKDKIFGELTLVFSSFKTNLKINSVGFVCSGNTCRSVMAEMYTRKVVMDRKIDIRVSSAGMYVDENSSVPQEVIKILEKEGIKISNNFPRQIDRPFVELNDLILTMTKEQ